MNGDEAGNPSPPGPALPDAPTTHRGAGAHARYDRLGRIAVLGATGSLGSVVVRRLVEKGMAVTAVGRDRARLAVLPADDVRVADVAVGGRLSGALDGAAAIVVCTPPHLAPAILDALPATVRRLVLIGSTRLYTRFPDRRADRVREAAAAFEASALPGVMLHPTMVYGGRTEQNVKRLAVYIRKVGVIPLPQGGKALVQPIYVDDVARAAVSALGVEASCPRQLVVAGPEALVYADFVRAVARAIGRRVIVVPVPRPLLEACAPVTRLLPGLPRITTGEVRRLVEDKAFEIDEMRACLGVEPIPLEDGLARTFAPDAP